jgi:hypothetical protein
VDFIEKDYIYDLETYPNVFTFSIIHSDGRHKKTFEVSDRKNQTSEILHCLRYLKSNKCRMVGFNNLGFDYPVLHHILSEAILAKKIDEEYVMDAKAIYKVAMKQIESFKGEGFGHTIPTSDVMIKQVDLYKIHHFDNKARSTSLKMLEFNMKSDNIEDLPFPVGKILTDEEIDVLIQYNEHDVKMTLDFYRASLDAIRFREKLGISFGIDFTNHNDTKVGKDYFINKLENAMPGSCYKMQGPKRVLNQTKRKVINIRDCLFDYYDFQQPAFVAILEWFRNQKITETKGVFSDVEEHNLGDVAKYAEVVVKRKKFKDKPTEEEAKRFKEEHPMGWIEEQELKATYTVLVDGVKTKVHKISYWGCWKVAETLNVVVNGFRFDFGTGGIHGSVESKIVRAKEGWTLKDADVASMYPNIAISNRVYPLHLTAKFCDIYQDVYNQRKMYPKDSPENAVMKLALNGVYGDSNNQYSPFYDPQYTMITTINGQLSLCMLAERLLTIPDLEIVQVNTDGVTVMYPSAYQEMYDEICTKWQKDVKLELEYADYSAMFVRDVNNYIALYTNGKVKRKGAYEYEGLGWHQNQSCLVVPKAVEAFMLHGTPVEEYIMNHKDKYDFMLRTKVPRSSSLVLVYEDGFEAKLQNICRYYPSKQGGKLVKIMPPLVEGGELRRLGIDVEWNVKPCNDITKFKWDLDYDYYISEANKLIISEECIDTNQQNIVQ